MLKSVEGFQERRTGSSASTSSSDGDGGGSNVAWAALRLSGCIARSFLALKFTLWLGTVGGLDALVLAGESFADGCAVGFGSNASRMALRGFADGLALRTALQFTSYFGATNGASWFLAVDGTLGTSDL